MSVVSMVVGAPVPDGAEFVCKVNGGGPVRVAVAEDSMFSSTVFTSSQAVDAQGVAKLSISGLDPSTSYWWRTEDNSVVDDGFTGQFLTAPVAGSRSSLIIGAAGDAGLSPVTPGTGAVLDPTGNRVSNHEVFDLLRTLGLTHLWQAFIHLGDLHYYDLGDAFPGTTANYRQAYDDVLAQSLQHALYRSVPWVYGWDDHCYGPNNGDGTLATKANALTAYGERVPHGVLGGIDGIYRSWEWGRVLFILSDIRYNRSPNSDPDGPSKTMLGATQKTWMEGVLTSSDAKALIWVNPQQWLGTTADSWASFATERAELVEMFGDTGWLGRMSILSADYHGVALDSGTNSAGSIPVLQAAAMDATPGAGTGGTYDRGTFDGRNQYGTISITDLGQALQLVLTGWRGTDQLAQLTFSVPGDPPAPIATGALLRTLQGSHRMMVEARVLRTYQSGEDPDGEEVVVIDGDVQIDVTQDTQRTANVTTRGKWFRRASDSLLSVLGNEVFLRRGVDLGSETLWTPLGYYRIDTMRQPDASAGNIQLDCFDRMKGVIDARLVQPRTYRPTTLVSVFFEDLVGEIYPEAVIFFDDNSGSTTLGREVLVEQDRYGALLDVANGLGKVMEWSDQGVLVVRTVTTSQPPVWDVPAGFKGVKIVASRQLTRAGVHNALVATGEGGDQTTPVRAMAFDANPLSPTFFGGRFGKVPRFYSSPFLVTQQQAQNTARDQLQRSIGLPYKLDFQSVVNHALRGYDPVRVRFNDGSWEFHVMDKISIPLNETTSMTGVTREQTLPIIEVEVSV